MTNLLRNRWVQVASGYVVAAVLVAVIVVLAVLLGSAEESSAAWAGDRVFLTSGGAIIGGSTLPGYTASRRSEITVDVSLPLTAAEAVADGWTDPILCSSGRGRYFQKGAAGEGEPFFLMYNADDQLIGMYLFSMSEMPTPWKRLDELRGGGGLTLLDFEHWGLLEYFQDPSRACGVGLLGPKRPPLQGPRRSR